MKLSERVKYRHKQFGTITSIPALVGTPLFLLLGFIYEQFFLMVLALVFLLLGFLFWSLTITVTNHLFQFSFGIGIIQRTFSLDEIKQCKPIRTKFWHGWGIHYVPGGWLYNVGGYDAVELQLKNGKSVKIGTDEPQRVCKAIA